MSRTMPSICLSFIYSFVRFLPYHPNTVLPYFRCHLAASTSKHRTKIRSTRCVRCTSIEQKLMYSSFATERIFFDSYKARNDFVDINENERMKQKREIIIIKSSLNRFGSFSFASSRSTSSLFVLSPPIRDQLHICILVFGSSPQHNIILFYFSLIFFFLLMENNNSFNSQSKCSFDQWVRCARSEQIEI